MGASAKSKETGDVSAVAAHDPPVYEDAVARSNVSAEMSPGVKRIELINSQLGLYSRICLFASVWLVAYVYGLDGTVRNTYQVCLTLLTTSL